jgi:hypothetical protein
MSKPSLEQGLQGLLSLAVNVDWSKVDADLFQRTVVQDPVGAGAQLTAFLRNGGRVIVGEPKVVALQPSTLFNPAKFIGDGWTIEEEDERSLALTQIDLTAIRLELMLKPGETSVKGENKLTRLKDTGHIRLDDRWFQFLWENQHMIPASWKELTNGNTTFIYFDGTVLRDPSGDRCALCLFWQSGQWYWGCDWLDNRWSADSPSAVLVS